MLVLMKIGIIVTFGVLFFTTMLYINTLILKKKKKREAEKKRAVKISDEEYESLGKSEIEEIEPAVKELNEKARRKYLIFKKAFHLFNYRKYRLLKLGLSVGLFILFTFMLNFVFGIIGFIAGRILPDAISNYIVKKNINKFEIQLADGLTLIANSLKAGASFTQAVEAMVNEMKPPLATEFGIFLKNTRMGVSVEEALENLAKRVDSEELKIAVVSINIARQAGGNLSEILLHTADTIRERERIKGKIDSLTAQGKMSGIVVGSLPLALALILYKIDPVMMGPLFNTFIGQLILLLILLMEFVGFLWIKKIIAIDI